MKLSAFQSKLRSVLKKLFSEVNNKSDVFEFGVFTDQDVSTITLGYNTYGHLGDQLKNWFVEDKIIVSDFRWKIPDWYNDELGFDSDLLNELNEGLGRLSEEGMENTPEGYKDVLLDSITEVLLELKRDGLFDEMGDGFIIYLEQADSFIDEKMKERVKRLLSEELYMEFLHDRRFDIE